MECTKLPQEILHQIFELLCSDKDALIQLQLTCREWSHAARELLYTDLGDEIDWDAETTSLLVRTLESSDSAIAHSIKSICAYEPSSKDDMLAIARLCPNLTTINSLTYAEMLTLYKQGYLQQLQEVDYPTDAQENSASLTSYNQLVLAAKKTIRKLYISRESQDALAKHLDGFTNLKKLLIDYKEGISFVELSNLFRNKTNIPRDLRVNKVNATMPASSADNGPLSQVISMPQVRILDFSLSSFSLGDLKLVKTMFPALEKLTMSEFYYNAPPLNDTLVTSEERTRQTILEFFNYLLCVEEFDSEKFAVPTEVLLAFMSDQKNNHRITNINIRVKEFQDNKHNAIGLYTTSYSKDKSCILNIELNEQQLNEAFCQRLFTVMEEFVNLSTIQLFSVGNSSGSDSKPLGSFVGHILTRFSNLKELGLLGIALPSLPPMDVLDKKLALDFLMLAECEAPSDYLLQLSQPKLDIQSLTERDEASDDLRISTEINMPYTTIQNIFLARGEDEFLFKVYTNCRTFYYDSGASFREGSALDKAQYNKIVRNSGKGFDIQCADLQSLGTRYDEINLQEAN
ncbi:hypothetical protein MBANPS3_005360 [Mucor bainieri]